MPTIAKHSCTYCRSSHLRCSGGQPCERCLRRRIAHLCNYSTTCSELAAPPVGTPIDSAYSDIVNQERAIHARNYDMDLSCAHLREFNRKFFTKEANERISTASAWYRFQYQLIRRSLRPQDVAESEEFVANTLFEYDRVIEATATPFCVIRRSGEILRTNKTFSQLVGVTRTDLLNYWHFFQLLTEEACVNYWEQIIPLFADPTAGVLMGSTVIRRGGPFASTEKADVECLMVARVQHDRFKMPALVAISITPRDQD